MGLVKIIRIIIGTGNRGNAVKCCVLRAGKNFEVLNGFDSC